MDDLENSGSKIEVWDPPYEMIGEHMAPYEMIGEHMVPYEMIGEHMVPYEMIGEHMDLPKKFRRTSVFNIIP